MEFEKKTPEEYEIIKQREIQEFAEAERKAEARGEHQNKPNHVDSTDEVEPSNAHKFQEHHGNRKYSMFKNRSSSDDIPGTITDTH